MSTSFIASSTVSSNGKVYIPVPFNIWEAFGKKGMLNAKVCINDFSFESRLPPKGNGYYYIPITKTVQNNIGLYTEYKVDFEIINQLTRINNNSPYSTANPVRTIASINSIIQPKAKMCGQTCVAMLAGATVEEVVNVMHAGSGQASMSKIIETLDYYGLKHADKMVYITEKNTQLPKLCILNVRLGKAGHFLIYYNNKFYDPSEGMLDTYDSDKIVGYLEIFT